jgi:hypothetical protein
MSVKGDNRKPSWPLTARKQHAPLAKSFVLAFLLVISQSLEVAVGCWRKIALTLIEGF